MRRSQFSAAFECMCTFSPCDRVGVCVERRAFADIAVEVISHLRTEIRLAAANADERGECPRIGPGSRLHTQLWKDGDSVHARNKPKRVFLGRRIGETVDRICSRAAHSESSFIEKSRRERRGEIDGQHLRRAMRDAVEPCWPHARRVVRMRGLVAPARVDFVPCIEVVIDFEVELLAHIGLAEAESIRTASSILDPAIIARVQTIADFVVIRLGHRAQHFFDVTGGIHLVPIGIPW